MKTKDNWNLEDVLNACLESDAIKVSELQEFKERWWCLSLEWEYGKDFSQQKEATKEFISNLLK